MSIRSVKCPSCGTSANVPVGMANVKCGSCGSIWNVNHPGSTSGAAKRAKEEPSKDSSGGSANKQQATLIAGIAGVLGLLALVGIGFAFFVRGTSETAAPPQATLPPVADTGAAQPAVTTDPIEPVPTYREVDLPESTRQQIYLDYRNLVASSTEKKLMIMKESPVNKSLQGMLGKTVDREITHFSLLHKISEDDVMQIVAEGDAKQWPGSRPPSTDPASASATAEGE